MKRKFRVEFEMVFDSNDENYDDEDQKNIEEFMKKLNLDRIKQIVQMGFNCESDMFFGESVIMNGLNKIPRVKSVKEIK